MINRALRDGGYYILKTLTKDDQIAKLIELLIVHYSIIHVKENKLKEYHLECIYTHKLSDLLYNLFHNTNILKNIDISRICYLDSYDLDDNTWKKIIDKKINTEKILNNMPTISVQGVICKKCKNDRFYFRQLQTRAADEPITNFMTCNKCGWQIRF